ncbi:MAG: hypothetical protein CMN96_02240 [Synechococcus sp. MED850]|jgi:predicted DCC family thiol-disulfide oxidoreductase YuxK|nr:hypothetical protein [Synechococcus sp. MED850]
MAITLVYDGGCPFCRHFALTSELAAGIQDLEIKDGRADGILRNELRSKGMELADGAVLLDGEDAWHGSDAVSELCRRMTPSGPLLLVLKAVFRDHQRSKALYPSLLVARRVALRAQGLPVNPDQPAKPA